MVCHSASLGPRRPKSNSSDSQQIMQHFTVPYVFVYFLQKQLMKNRTKKKKKACCGLIVTVRLLYLTQFVKMAFDIL